MGVLYGMGMFVCSVVGIKTKSNKFASDSVNIEFWKIFLQIKSQQIQRQRMCSLINGNPIKSFTYPEKSTTKY